MPSDSRRIVQKTLSFDSPERIPRQCWVLPWAEEHYPDVIEQLHQEFPDDIVQAPSVYNQPLNVKGERYRKGTYVDEWGCVFSNPIDGVIGIVQHPLVADWTDLEHFHPPESVLNIDRDAINAFCKKSEEFVLAGALVRPFERLQFVRTMEKAMIDLVEQSSEFFELLDRIHQAYLKEVEVWAQTEVDAIFLMDDWGTQQGMIASPELFRRIFKPMYKEYAEIARHHGKHVFMHSDGYILDIISDLIEAGVESLNSQVFCMGIKELGEKYRGKITFWGEIDRQNLLPYASRREIEEAVVEVWKHLYADGGVIAQCEFGLEADPANIFTFYKTWEFLSRSRRKG